MERIRKGDEVVVIAGKDKGKRGVVLRRVDTSHLVVEGVNVVKKHVRPNPMKAWRAASPTRPCPSTSPT